MNTGGNKVIKDKVINSSAQPSDVAILKEAQEFAVLKEEWEDLYRNSPRATPFQSWAWLYSWWEFYGEGYELRLITVRSDEGLLIGLAPLMLERRLGLRKLLFVGTGPTDYLDVLAREGWETQVLEALARTLRQMGSWRVADLQELSPESTTWACHSSTSCTSKTTRVPKCAHLSAHFVH
jgi:CelD/BcsL family acetyltransferase involved in cellulose biosynthesis